MENTQLNSETLPIYYHNERVILTNFLNRERANDPSLEISDAKVAELTGVSEDIVYQFRSQDRAIWGKARPGRKPVT